MSIGERLKQLRKGSKLSQEEFVDRFNQKTGSFLKRSAYSNYENLRRERIPHDLIPKFADFYHVSIDYLHGRETVEIGNTKKLTYKGRELSQEEMEKLNEYVEFLLSKSER